MKIGQHVIDRHSPTFIIAELSANHNGSIKRAKKTILEAKNSGVSAVKIQTYTPDTMTIDCSQKDFLIKGTIWEGDRLYSLYQKAYTPWEWHEPIMKHARSRNLLCFSSPFDESAIDFLESLDVPAYKIASFECIDLPLIKKAANTKKPLIIIGGGIESSQTKNELLSFLNNVNIDLTSS